MHRVRKELAVGNIRNDAVFFLELRHCRETKVFGWRIINAKVQFVLLLELGAFVFEKLLNSLC